MKTTSTFILCYFFLLTSFASWAQYNIVGPSEACLGESETFQYTDPIPTGATIVWSATDADFYGATGTSAVFGFNNLNETTIEAEVFSAGVSIDISTFEVMVVNSPVVSTDFSGNLCKLYRNIREKYEFYGISACVDDVIYLNTGNHAFCEIEFEGFVEDISYVQNGCDFEIHLPSAAQAGQINVTVSNNACESSISLELYILAAPVSTAETIPASQQNQDGNHLDICLNQTVIFNGARTTPIFPAIINSGGPTTASENNCNTYYSIWSIFDENNVLIYEEASLESSYVFNQPGNYVATFTSYSISGCSSNTVEFNIHVQEGETPTVECISTICATAQDTYTTDAECDVTWSIEGGNIIGLNTENTVVVQWTGEVSPGLLILTLDGCENNCSTTIVNEVPVIAASIRGPDALSCFDSQFYFLQGMAANSNVTWELIPDDVPGITMELNTQQNPKIIYDAIVPIESVILRATVTSPFHGCTQVTEKEIALFNAPEITVSGPDFICRDENLVVQINGIDESEYPNLAYNLLDNFGQIIVSNQPLNGNLTFSTSVISADGSYRFEIVNLDESNPAICGSSYFNFSVGSIANEIEFGTGRFEFCGSTPVLYEIEFVAGLIPEWTLIGGVTTEGDVSGTSYSFSVIWGGPGEIQVRWIAPGSDCDGPLNIIEVEPISNAVSISGEQEVCANSSTVYTFEETDIAEWSLSIPTAGSITIDPLESTIEIYWNQTTVPINVDLILTFEHCVGAIEQLAYPILVNPTPVPTILGDQSVCFADLLTLNSSLVAEVYTWFLDGEILPNESGQTISLSPENLDLELGLHSIRLSVLNPEGCIGITEAIHSFTVNPSPFAAITSPLPNCPTCEAINEYELVASEQPSNQGVFDYFWTQDFMELPQYNDQRILNLSGGSNVHGIYRVSVVNTATQCTSVSNPFIVDCSSGPGLPQGENVITWGLTDVPGQVRFSGSVNALSVLDEDGFVTVGTCGSGLETINLNQVTSCQYSWTIKDPINGVTQYPYGPDYQFNHLFDHPGYYQVSFTSICPGTDPNTWEIGAEEVVVIVPYIIDQIIDIECDPAGGLITLTDNTDYLPAYADALMNWNITGNGMAYDLSVSPGMQMLTPGPWDIVTTLTHPDVNALFWDGYGPAYTLNEFVKIGLLDGSISGPSEVCESTGAPFEFYTDDEFYNQIWSFDDGTSFIGSQLIKTFPFDPNFPTRTVQLTAVDFNGCVYEYTQSIEVIENELNPEIELVPNSCPNVPYVLNALVNSNEEVNYLWSTQETSQSIIAAEETYWVQVSNSIGCRANSDKVGIQIELPTEVTFKEPLNTLCEDGFYEFSVTQVDGATYNWFENGVSFPNSGPTRGVNLTEGQLQIEVEVIFPDNCGIQLFERTFVVSELDDQPQIELEYDCEGETATLTVTNYESGDISWSLNNSQSNVLSGLYPGNYVVKTIGACPSGNEVRVSPIADLSGILAGCYDFCSADFDAQDVYLPIRTTFAIQSWQLVHAGTTELACADCQGTGNINQQTIQITSDWESGSYQLVVVLANGCVRVSDPLNVELNNLSYVDFDPISCDDLNADGSYTVNAKITSSFLEEEILFESTTGTVEIAYMSEEEDGVRTVELTYMPTEEEGEHCIQLTATNDNISCSDERCFDLPICCFNGSMEVLEAECIGDGYFTFLLEVTNNGAYQYIEIDLLSDDNLFDVFSITNLTIPAPNVLPNGVSLLLVTASYAGSCTEALDATVQLHLVQIDCNITVPITFECCQTPCNDLAVDVDCSDAEAGVVTLTVAPPTLNPEDQITYAWTVNGVVASYSNSITLTNAEQSTYSVEIAIFYGDTECKTTLEGVIDCIPCSNVTFPGVICCNQTICAGGSAEFTFTQLPTGGEGELTYMWRLSSDGMIDTFYEINGTTFVLNDYLAPGEYAVAACVAAEGCSFVETEPVELIVEACDPCESDISVEFECAGSNSILTAYVNGQLATTDQINFWQVEDIIFPAQNPLTVANEAGSTYSLFVEFEVDGTFCNIELTGIIDCDPYDCQNEPDQCGSSLNPSSIVVQEAGGYTYISYPPLVNESFMVKLYEECVFCNGDLITEPEIYFSENGEVELDYQLSDLIYGSIEIYAIKEDKCELVAASCFIDIQDEKKSMNADSIEEMFTLFPNPTGNGEVFINYRGANTSAELVSLEITDAKGRVVQSQRVQLNGLLAIDISLLNAGVYLISLTNEEEQQLFLERLVLLK